MTLKAIDTLKDHWDGLREKDLPPMRSDIDPRAMPDVLDSLFILEVMNPSDIRIRIAGLGICEMMGMEVRGQTPLTFFNENSRGRFAAVLADVLNRPTIARLELASTDKLGNVDNVQMILLPLRSDLGNISRIIGCMTKPDDFKSPVSFQVRAINLESLKSGKSVPETALEEVDQAQTYLMDGNPSLRSIVGNAALKPLRQAEKPAYLKVVE